VHETVSFLSKAVVVVHTNGHNIFKNRLEIANNNDLTLFYGLTEVLSLTIYLMLGKSNVF